MKKSDLEEFCKTAEVYGVDSSVWLVNGEKLIATHCSDITYSSEDWDAVYDPSHEKFLEFLEDKNWRQVAKKYPQFQDPGADLSSFQFTEPQVALIETLLSQTIAAKIFSDDSSLQSIDYRQAVEMTDSVRFDLRCFLKACLDAVRQASPDDLKSPGIAEQIVTLEDAIALVSTSIDDMVDIVAEAYEGL